jgi:hypothetical protein
MIKTTLTALALLGAFGATAIAGPYGEAYYGSAGGYRGEPYRAYPRQRIVVRPRGYAYPDYYATSRGFEDPGFALRGNMPGCAVDLGYGRWESCDR